MPERVALTGATGFIGRNLLSALAQSHIPVRALTRRPLEHSSHEHSSHEYSPHKHSPREHSTHVHSGPVTWIPGDLDNPSALRDLADGCTAVIHCAGVVRGNSPEDFAQVNVKGTENLLNAVREKPVKPKLLLISSLAARHPEYSWYARSKSQAETLLMSGPYSGIPWTIFRPTAVYGPGDKEMQPLFSLMRRGFLFTPKVEGARISLLHINDLTHAIMEWITHQPGPEQAGGIFELDDGKKDGYRWEEIIHTGQEAWGHSIRQLEVPVPALNLFANVNLFLARIFRYSAMLTPGKIKEMTHKDWVCDNRSLTNHLGWRPKIKLRDALNEASLSGG